MMPSPEEVARLVDRAEQIASHGLAHRTAEDRRRLLAEAVFECLRHDFDGAASPDPVPVPT